MQGRWPAPLAKHRCGVAGLLEVLGQEGPAAHRVNVQARAEEAQLGDRALTRSTRRPTVRARRARWTACRGGSCSARSSGPSGSASRSAGRSLPEGRQRRAHGALAVAQRAELVASDSQLRSVTPPKASWSRLGVWSPRVLFMKPISLEPRSSAKPRARSARSTVSSEHGRSASSDRSPRRRSMEQSSERDTAGAAHRG